MFSSRHDKYKIIDPIINYMYLVYENYDIIRFHNATNTKRNIFWPRKLMRSWMSKPFFKRKEY